jgi:hypothetical protein
MGMYDAHHNIATELIGSDAQCSAFDVTNVGDHPRHLPSRLRVFGFHSPQLEPHLSQEEAEGSQRKERSRPRGRWSHVAKLRARQMMIKWLTFRVGPPQICRGL